MAETLTVDEAKQKTLELLGTDDPAAVEHITEDLLSSDLGQGPDEGAEKITGRIRYGHSMSYGYANGEQIYRWKSTAVGDDINDCCGSSPHWAPMSTWDHYGTDKRCGPAEYQRILKFVENS